MKYLLAAAAVAALVPAAAQAQDSAMFNGGYVGVQTAYHDIDGGAEDFVLGGYIGYNMPASETIVLGVEGNFNFGLGGDIDSEYGASAHIGVRVGETSMLFARAGYQEVNFDVPGSLAGFDVDDTDGGLLLGVGGEFGVANNTSMRVTVDTIEFDSARIGVGVSFHF